MQLKAQVKSVTGTARVTLLKQIAAHKVQVVALKTKISVLHKQISSLVQKIAVTQVAVRALARRVMRSEGGNARRLSRKYRGIVKRVTKKLRVLTARVATVRAKIAALKSKLAAATGTQRATLQTQLGKVQRRLNVAIRQQKTLKAVLKAAKQTVALAQQIAQMTELYLGSSSASLKQRKRISSKVRLLACDCVFYIPQSHSAFLFSFPLAILRLPSCCRSCRWRSAACVVRCRRAASCQSFQRSSWLLRPRRPRPGFA